MRIADGFKVSDCSVVGFLTLDPLAFIATSLKQAAAQIVKVEGVSYGSKGADYAEWLQKLHPEEDFKFGHVVEVFGGKITKSIRGADQVLAISIHPVCSWNDSSCPDQALSGRSLSTVANPVDITNLTRCIVR